MFLSREGAKMQAVHLKPRCRQSPSRTLSLPAEHTLLKSHICCDDPDSVIRNLPPISIFSRCPGPRFLQGPPYLPLLPSVLP